MSDMMRKGFWMASKITAAPMEKTTGIMSRRCEGHLTGSDSRQNRVVHISEALGLFLEAVAKTLTSKP